MMAVSKITGYGMCAQDLTTGQDTRADTKTTFVLEPNQLSLSYRYGDKGSSFLGVRSGQNMNLSIHFHLVLKSRL
jgi:hypothetical protein